MKMLIKIIEKLAKYMDIVAGVALVSVMLLVSLDVILRYMGYPIIGSYDLVSMGGVLIVGFSIPRTSLDKIHIIVDIVIEKFGVRSKKFLNILTRLLVLLFFTALTWYLIKHGLSYLKTGESTMTLAIPFYPVILILGACCFIECLVLLAQIYVIISDGGQHE